MNERVAITAETIQTVFQEMGLRSTRPRRLIAERLALLAAQGRDFTTDDFWRELQQEDAQLGRATVFRAVDVLVERGVLDRVEFPDGTHRYRVCGDAHHHHLTCTNCRRIVEIDACLPPDLLAAIEISTNFAVEGHALELFGRCANCQRADEA